MFPNPNKYRGLLAPSKNARWNAHIMTPEEKKKAIAEDMKHIR